MLDNHTRDAILAVARAAEFDANVADGGAAGRHRHRVHLRKGREMKAAIVRASFLASQKRWDAAYYCGNLDELEDELKAAEANLKRAAARVERAKAAIAADIERTTKLREAGHVIPLE